MTSGTVPFTPPLTVETGSYYKTTPSGLRMTVTTDGAFPNGASGSYFMTPPQTGTGGLNPNGAGSNPGAFTLSPVMPTGANAIQLATSVNPCQTTFPASTTCTGLGTLRIAFTDPLGGAVPVVAPKLHVSRLGGTIGAMELATGLQINAGGSTPGISFSAIAGARTATLTVNGTEFFGDPNVPGWLLNVNCGVAAGTSAGCGSVQVNGNPSTILFNVKAYRTTVAPNNWTGGVDGYWLDVSFDEDYGGAPTSYEGGGTAAAHILTDLRLGSGVSAERIAASTDANGGATGASLFTTSPNAVANGSPPGDSNDAGVTFPTLAVSMTGATYTVTPTISGASRGGELCGWIDFDDNNAFAASEGSCATFAAGATSVPLNWTLPSGMVAGFTYARFRVTYDTTISTASFNGLFSSGEVEDYSLTILPAIDYSDAPTAGFGGANHTIDGVHHLGAGVTTDAGDYNDANAAGDVDDGAVLPVLIQGVATTIPVTVAGAGGYLSAWIDWTGDGDFADVDEGLWSDLQDGGVGDADATVNGVIQMNVVPPASAITTQTFARFRWSTSAGTGPSGAAGDGEVEDYALTVQAAAPALTVAKDAYEGGLPPALGGAGTPAAPNRPAGTVVTYVYTVSNTGNVTVNSVTAADAHNGLGVPPTPGSEVPVSVPNGSTDAAANGVWDVLKPGDQIAFTATYTINQDDVDQRQ
ncbi:MAG: hypothetical protein IPL47_08205 [Phyllobacteriaceae bacterium]|nr:hypothetical protein [Phyllobacteriaceae bacterium]